MRNDSSNVQERRRFSALFGIALCLGLLTLSRSTPAQEESSRFEVAPVFADFHAPFLSQAAYDQLLLGGRFTWNCLPYVSLEGEYASTLQKPGAETQNGGGYFSQALFGVKSGVRWKRWGVFGKFRPGLASYSMAITSANTSRTGMSVGFGRLNNAAFDLGGGAEFFISRRWLFRYDASDLITHQGSHDFLLNEQRITFSPFTNHNFESEVSVAFRF